MNSNILKNNSSLIFIAMLVAYGGIITKTDRSEGIRKVKFDVDVSLIKRVFLYINGEIVQKDNPTLDDLLNLYTSRRIMLPPEYPTVTKELKSLIHGQNNK